METWAHGRKPVKFQVMALQAFTLLPARLSPDVWYLCCLTLGPLLSNPWQSWQVAWASLVAWEVAEGLHVHVAGDPPHHKWTSVSRGGCTRGTATWCSAGIPALSKEPFFWWRWNAGRKNLPGIRSVLSTNPFSLQKYTRSRQGTWPRLGSTSPSTAFCISICACWDGGGGGRLSMEQFWLTKPEKQKCLRPPQMLKTATPPPFESRVSTPSYTGSTPLTQLCFQASARRRQAVSKKATQVSYFISCHSWIQYFC